jgi:hypothetical protein
VLGRRREDAVMSVKTGTFRNLIHAIGIGPKATERRRSPAWRAANDLRLEHAGWWQDRNVVGMCIARKVQGGKQGGLTLQVLVREKLPHGRLRRERRIPEEIETAGFGMPARVRTDVRAVGTGRLDSLVSDARPILPGFSIGGRRTGSGTLACAVRSRATQARLGLSCGHVIARYGMASPGERVLAPSYDDALAADMLPLTPLGTLVTVLPVGFEDADASSNVDAATFAPNSESDLDTHLALLGVAPTGVRSSCPLGLPVRKVGAATEVTFGEVQALHLLAALPYRSQDGRTREALFADLVGVSSFTQAGDSGALVIDEAGAAVGLHIGSFRGMSVCMPLGRVLEAVNSDLA